MSRLSVDRVALKIFHIVFLFNKSFSTVTEDWPPESVVQDLEQFHFIVVGGGSAGCVVANRLSEVEHWKILLIEAGGDPPITSIIPALFSNLHATEYDWQYSTVSTGKTSRANLHENVKWSRGKMLGGSSSMNVMIYAKGKDYDFQKWFDEGNREWDPITVRYYNKKAESFQNLKGLKNSSVKRTYGHNGPQVINYFNSTDEALEEALLSAWDEIGFKRVSDINENNVLGSGPYAATAANGRRYSTAKAYLNPVKDRPNLKIIKNTLVTKIFIHKVSLEAYGVQVNRNGSQMTFYATKEVILSAGTINTPQLLMLSGVGPQKHLESKGIVCKFHSPAVGQYLQDHIFIPITIYGNLPGKEDPAERILQYETYFLNSTGYLATHTFATSFSLYGYENSTFAQFQNFVRVFPKKSDQVYPFFQHLYKPSVVQSIIEQNDKHALYLYYFHNLHPYSKGNISLNTANPRDAPLIYANYFDDTRDLRFTVDGIKMLTKIIKTSFFKSIHGYLGRMKWPACDEFELDTKDYWECIAVNMVQTINHPVGTARMGPNPKTSVVDSHLRVHGIGKVRVIDASVMPSLTSGNTNCPTIMIAERASDLIKSHHRIQDEIHIISLN